MAFDPTRPVSGETPASSAPIRANWLALQSAAGAGNLLADPIFEIWPAGDTADPAYWTRAGAGSSIARAGFLLADTNVKVAKFCAKVTAGAGAIATLTQRILPATNFVTSMRTGYVSVTAWIRSTSAGGAKIGLSDGFSPTYSTETVLANTWTKVTVTKQLHITGAISISFFMEVVAGQTGYLSGPNVVLGEVPPTDWHPGCTKVVEIVRFFPGTQVAGANKPGSHFFFKRPSIVRSVQLMQQTAPVVSGTNLIYDINHYDGAVFQSMYSTRPEIVAGNPAGLPRAPDGTYRYRCFEGLNTNSQTDRVGNIDIDLVGSINPGVDVFALIHALSYDRPFEAVLNHDETK